ncbi:MAG: YkgJ family cysteine cluster protein [Candidatus Gottesmanbacteria bacterium]|nr:YkgJ family cysteine cluster protein [Candidatus Gottesmanbacteria bacterium]
MNYEGPIIRKLALELHNNVDWSTHPCHLGNGDCCEENVPTGAYDRHVIYNAIRTGNISQVVVAQAKERAAQNEESCGFFNLDTRSCDVYNFRPANCIIAGTGGFVNEKSHNAIESVFKYRHTGEDDGVAIMHMGTSMCRGCHNKLAKQGKRIRVAIIEAYCTVIDDYRNNSAEIMKINDFITEIK